MTVAMPDSPPGTERSRRRTYRDDYRPPAFHVPQLDLEIELGIPTTRVTARLHFECNTSACEPLRLDGLGLRLRAISLGGEPLTATEYLLDETGLTIHEPPARGELCTSVDIDVTVSKAEGIVCLDGALVTNCEPEGFRRITFFPDRPDVLTRTSCLLIADAREYPTLLSNGNLLESGALPGGRHSALWRDPFAKACYLFAIAAGRFARLTDTFVTISGRSVELSVHALAQDLSHCIQGLSALKQAMQWDEGRYGREYDLDALNVVVLRSYPGGAMECKGLNLYATEFFLSGERISTDAQRMQVAGVVAHEYFHNWSGNRVGCRNWFELSLKEGFTVLRQQQFVADLIGHEAARIDAMTRLRELQYPEDEGGLAHAVRPASYVAISNFYTRTVYEKGAELIRMMGVIAGEERFHAAARAFFDGFDGQATTIDAFIKTIETVAGADLKQFRAWYDVIGRPCVRIHGEYDPERHRYTLTLSQRLPGPSASEPLHIPVTVGFIDKSGAPLSVMTAAAPVPSAECLLHLRAVRQTFVFDEVESEPLLSVSRGYSAPVDIEHDLHDEDLATLAVHDTSGCGRHEAARQLALRAIHRVAGAAAGSELTTEAWLKVIEHTLVSHRRDVAVAGRLLRLPSLPEIMQGLSQVDLDSLAAARAMLRREVSRRFRELLIEVRRGTREGARNAEAFELRLIRNRCLWYLACDAGDVALAECHEQLRTAHNMEDELAALRLLVDAGGTVREQALAQTDERWRHTPAAVDHWFAAQASSEDADCAEAVGRLMQHRAFSLENATRVKAVLDAFTANLQAFHQRDGIGYSVVSEAVRRLSVINPRLAARFLKRFDGWHRFDARRRELQERVLRQLLSMPRVADELREIASESLRVGTAVRAAHVSEGRT